MEPNTAGVGFKIWGVDNVVYGPVELPTLVNWVKDQRVPHSLLDRGARLGSNCLGLVR